MFVGLLDRIARHWFLFFLVFGAYCAMIAGAAGELYGVPNLFLDDPALDEFGQIALFANGPIFLSQLAATTLIGMIWLIVSLLDAHTHRQDVVHSFTKHLVYLLPRVVIGSLFSLAACAYALWSTPAETSLSDLGRGMMGAAAGVVFVVLNLAAAHIINRFLQVRIIYLIMGLVIAFLIVLTLIPKLIPAISIAIVLGWFVAIYGLIGLLPEGLKPLAIIGVVGVITVANGTQFKYNFDGIRNGSSSYYDEGKRVKLYRTYDKDRADRAQMANQLFERKIVPRRLRNFEVDRPSLLDPIDVLEAWKKQTGLDDPKLVVISTSGGAYRAAFWTAIILDKLREESKPGGAFPGLDKHIALITGASGGMIGGAYFAAGRQPDGPTLTFDSIEAQLEADILQAATVDRFGTRFPIPRDSLSTVTQQLVQRDILHLFNPSQQSTDRGKVLESHWTTLKLPFSSYRDGEKEGWRPSLIFSPMIVETGQPLLISNLNLSSVRVESPRSMVWTSGGRVGGSMPKMMREKRLRETVEFFKLFPGAENSFRLNTAARMSASFAYISPAVELPTIPARRVVDAGYYDNYGVSIAIAYLKQERIKQWIEDNTSGVVIVQIRAYPSTVEEDDRAPRRGRRVQSIGGEIEQCEQIKLSQLLSREPTWVERAFHWITSPLEGQETARQSSMLFRNNQELRLLQGLYPDNFLQTVSFENAASISLNWYLPEHEMNCLRDEIVKAQNTVAFERLSDFWKRPMPVQ